MKRKIKNVFCCIVLCLLVCICSTPLQAYASYEDTNNNGELDSDDYVSFDMIGIGGELSVSNKMPYSNSAFYALSHSIYNYYENLYSDNADFPDFFTFEDRILHHFPDGFFNSLVSNHWLVNACVTTNNYVYIFFSRYANVQDLSGVFWDTGLEGGMRLSFEPNRQFGGVLYFHDYTDESYGCGMYAPYFEIEFSDYQFTSQDYTQFENNNVHMLTNWTGNVGILSDNNVRFIVECIQVQTPSLNIRYNGSLMGGKNIFYGVRSSNNVPSIFTNNMFRNMRVKDVLFSQFPIYYSPSLKIETFTGDYMNRIRYYCQQIDEFEYNEFLSNLVTIDSQNVIPPVATPTTTPLPTTAPTFTPIPTSTFVPQVSPIPPVTVVEGLGQMFTLFTRKYEFNFNGANIGIRPLYLFLACFFIGMIFKVIQGGGSE